jgi:protocatechuate 3,4-dioxygenase beta subunit
MSHAFDDNPDSRRRAFVGMLGALGAASVTSLVPRASATAAIVAEPTGSACAAELMFNDSFEAPLSSCVLVPSETDGPYPLYAILSNSALIRQDVTEGRPGLPLYLKIKLVNVNDNCAPITNAAVYVWHCDKDGIYSGYNQPGGSTVGQTFCRGIQNTDCTGSVVFVTMYPGWYPGRITHLHFQVYLNDNTSITATRTSQIAFPPEVTTAVYNSPLYVAHGQNSSVAGFAQDNVFSDGTTYQMLTVSGDTTSGYVGRLTVGVAA